VAAAVAAMVAVAAVAAAAAGTVAVAAVLVAAEAAVLAAVVAVVAAAGVSPVVASGPSQCCPTLACSHWTSCRTGGSLCPARVLGANLCFCDLFRSFSAPFENPDRCEIYGFFASRK
jgi:hypothetical protein